ncbi:MAG: hypothetical protein QNK05_09235 [Myxococcota bacterium]|nr:hypothetical protein [Myxococcota bacterium]
MPLLLPLLLMLCPWAVSAEAPASFAYQGQLLDAAGDPPFEPTIRVRIFDALTGGTELFAEEHGAVPVAADGRFELAVGTGTPIGGTLDAGLFAEANRFLEVAVNGEVLSPRQAMRSAPFALQSTETAEVETLEAVDGSGQLLGVVLNTIRETAFGIKGQPQGFDRLFEIRTSTGVEFAVNGTTGRIERIGLAFYLSGDCSGAPLLSASEAGRIVELVDIPTEPSEFLFVPRTTPQDGVVPGSFGDGYAGCRVPQPGFPPVDNLIPATSLPGDLPFTLPITPFVTTRPR